MIWTCRQRQQAGAVGPADHTPCVSISSSQPRSQKSSASMCAQFAATSRPVSYPASNWAARCASTPLMSTPSSTNHAARNEPPPRLSARHASASRNCPFADDGPGPRRGIRRRVHRRVEPARRAACGSRGPGPARAGGGGAQAVQPTGCCRRRDPRRRPAGQAVGRGGRCGAAARLTGRGEANAVAAPAQPGPRLSPHHGAAPRGAE